MSVAKMPSIASRATENLHFCDSIDSLACRISLSLSRVVVVVVSTVSRDYLGTALSRVVLETVARATF